jgi:hypothetical protein
MRKIFKIILSLAMIVLIAAALVGCTNDSATNAGEEITFKFEVTDGEGQVTEFDITTTETTVGAALLADGLIDGEVGEFGLMVVYVNGIRADYNEDGAWWAFYIDGEMAVTGVDSTYIEEGVVYAFIYTPS